MLDIKLTKYEKCVSINNINKIFSFTITDAFVDGTIIIKAKSKEWTKC